jgi:hypothetical protein
VPAITWSADRHGTNPRRCLRHQRPYPNRRFSSRSGRQRHDIHWTIAMVVALATTGRQVAIVNVPDPPTAPPVPAPPGHAAPPGRAHGRAAPWSRRSMQEGSALAPATTGAVVVLAGVHRTARRSPYPRTLPGPPGPPPRGGSQTDSCSVTAKSENIPNGLQRPADPRSRHGRLLAGLGPLTPRERVVARVNQGRERACGRARP